MKRYISALIFAGFLVSAAPQLIRAVELAFVSSATYDSSGDDSASAVAIDGSGYIFVTGTANGKYQTIKYNKSLIPVVTRTDDCGGAQATGIAIDNYNNVIVCGQTNAGDYILLKYDYNLSVVISSVVYDGGSTDGATGVCTDSEGNVIVTGFSADGATYNFVTIKYNRDLAPLFSRVFDSGGDDRAKSVTVDAENNIIVAGKSSGKYHIIKYDTNLNPLFDAQYNSGNIAEANCVVVDSSGSIIVTGYRKVSGATNDFYTIKYDSRLKYLCSVDYDGGGDDAATGITVDPQDNIIVTGRVNMNTNWNYYTVKYDNNLNILAKASYDSGNLDQAAAVECDSDGTIIVAGKSNDGLTLNYFTIQYGGSPVISEDSTLYQGETNEISIQGKSFTDGAVVSFAHSGIAVNSSAALPPNKIALSAATSENVALGLTTMTVTNANGEYAVKVDVPIEYRAVIDPLFSAEITPSLFCGRMRIAISSNTFLTISSVTISSLCILPEGTDGKKVTNIGVRITALPLAEPLRDVVITFPYTSEDIAGFNISRLAIAYYDTTTSKWNYLNSMHDVSSKIISCSTNRINGVFAVIELPPQIVLLNNVLVYPNPYKPGSGTDFDDSSVGKGIVFSNLTREFRMKIITIAGNLVFDHEGISDVNGNYLWNTKNNDGEEVASGIYLYSIVDCSDTSQKTKGKFAIIR